MKSLEKFNTNVFVSSTVYYEKEDIEKFIELFSSLKIVDFRLSKYVEILEKLLKSGSLDDLPVRPKNRKKKLISLIRTGIDSITDSKMRDKITTWFEDACEEEYDIELQDELLYRYCWAEFYDRVVSEDDENISFKDKLSIRPIVPDVGRKLIQSLDDVVIPEDDVESESKTYGTGITSLDEIVQMRRTNFVVVAARTTIGKSLFMINQAIYNAEHDNKILYCSLEENPVELKKRVLLHIGNNPNKDKILKNFIIFTPNSSSPTVILDDILKYTKENGISLVFVDYIQLMKYTNLNDWDSLRALTRDLKLFAVKNNILLVTASQLKREVEYTGSNLASLYGSSTLEADANTILILEPVRHQNVRINNTTAISIIVAKNRSGAQGKVENIIIDYSRGHIIET